MDIYHHPGGISSECCYCKGKGFECEVKGESTNPDNPGEKMLILGVYAVAKEKLKELLVTTFLKNSTCCTPTPLIRWQCTSGKTQGPIIMAWPCHPLFLKMIGEAELSTTNRSQCLQRMDNLREESDQCCPLKMESGPKLCKPISMVDPKPQSGA